MTNARKSIIGLFIWAPLTVVNVVATMAAETSGKVLDWLERDEMKGNE